MRLAPCRKSLLAGKVNKSTVFKFLNCSNRKTIFLKNSYEARAAGIFNGMFMGGALKLCPQLVAIPYDFEGYKEVKF